MQQQRIRTTIGRYRHLKSYMSEETRKLYRQINTIRKEFKTRTSTCINMECNLFTNIKVILARWVEYIQELEKQNGEPVETPTMEEVIIRKLKKRKSPGRTGSQQSYLNTVDNISPMSSII